MKRSKFFKGKISEYVIAFFAVFALFILFWVSGIKNNMYAARALIICVWIALGIYAFRLKRKDRLTPNAILAIITAAGMALGVGNMLGTSIFDKGYDQGYISASARGHFGYILNLVEGHLPNGMEEQYYQPPLFHFAASIFVRLGLLLTGGSADEAIQFTQIANCSVYCFLLIAVKNFIGELGMKEKYQPFVMAVIAFHPNFFLMGLRGNNDMFATFFLVLCIINTYRWYKNRDMKTIILLALSFGLGMMSKISVGVMALFTGAIMIYCLVCDFREKKYKEIITQLAVFAVICIPLAMWYPIRNLILFDQPLNYVQKLDESIPIYMGNVPWYDRFLRVPVLDMILNPFFEYPNGQSIIEHMLKTSLFVEYSFKSRIVICSVFAAVNMLTVAAALVSMVYTVVKGRELNRIMRFGFLWIWIIFIAAYIEFNISYPFLCTADFRYIPVTVIIGAVYMGYALQLTENKKLRTLAECVMLAFVVCSVLVYI